jgi:hypothetical protein
MSLSRDAMILIGLVVVLAVGTLALSSGRSPPAAVPAVRARPGARASGLGAGLEAAGVDVSAARGRRSGHRG